MGAVLIEKGGAWAWFVRREAAEPRRRFLRRNSDRDDDFGANDLRPKPMHSRGPGPRDLDGRDIVETVCAFSVLVKKRINARTRAAETRHAC